MEESWYKAALFLPESFRSFTEILNFTAPDPVE